MNTHSRRAWHSPLRPLALCIRLLLAGGALASLPVVAQSPNATTVEARIPPGPLAEALNRFALQAGTTIAIDAALVRGKSSQGLQGTVAVEDGFALINFSGQ